MSSVELDVKAFLDGDLAESEVQLGNDRVVLLSQARIEEIGDVREHFGRQAFLVGILCLDPGSDAFAVTMELLKRSRVNLFFSKSDGDVFVFTPEGGQIPLVDGDVVFENATRMPLMEFLARRIGVSWYKTDVMVEDSVDILPEDEGEIQRLIDFAHDSGLLTDHNGNLSCRLTDGSGSMAMSPRAVDKAVIGSADMLRVRVDHDSRTISSKSPSAGLKSSIDSGVSDYLYRLYPKLRAIIHTHCDWGVGFVQTSFPYPCGVKEEAEEVERVLGEGGYDGKSSFLLHLVQHGLLLGISGDLTTEQLEEQWEQVKADFGAHISQIGEDPEVLLERGKLEPIISPKGVVGYVFVDADGAVAPRLLESARGLGYGRDLIGVLKMKNATVKTVNDCAVEDFYVQHGFAVVERREREIFLEPKSV